jgi:hypothetical protein
MRAGATRAVLAAAALAVTALVTASPPATASPVDVVVRLSQLEHRTHPLELAWLDGHTLHRTDGSTLTLPWSRTAARERSLRLLGKTPEGWLVKDFTGNTWNVWLVRHGARTRLSQHAVSEGDIVHVTLSSDRQRYVVRTYSGDPSENPVTVRDLAGDVLASRLFPNDAEVLAFNGTRAVVGVADTQVWDVDADEVQPVGRDAFDADLAHDLAFVADPETSEVGPTSLSSPMDPPWSAPMRQITVSPDGDRVLSRVGGSRVFTVRDTVTGAVEKSFRISYPTGDPVEWESDDAFVIVGSPDGLGDHEVIARCTVAGRCTAASRTRALDTLSLPVVG